MAVRTQPSPTSLSIHATAKSPGVDLYNGNPSRDFCNSFWGIGDSGINILFTRMRGATKTTEELRNFWKERSIIEEEYANRLATLSKVTLGWDEIGELRNSLDTLRLETEKQAASHLHLAAQIRSELEAQTGQLLNKQLFHRRTHQAPLEKKFKARQTQESHVVRAREKYENDCARIATYSQQCETIQGKELERIQLKIQHTRQTAQANEKDFADFARGLTDMLSGWEKEWKDFCDNCQDLEEERHEFLKDTLWFYANEVSTLCVSDDQSCERIRTVLDQLEPDRDVENFVHEYGTGSSIPDPPALAPYSGTPGSRPSPSAPKTRPANFVRASRRPAPAYPTSVNGQAEQPQAPAPETVLPARPAVNGNGNTEAPSPPAHSGAGSSNWPETPSPRSVNHPAPSSKPSRSRGDEISASRRGPPPNVPPPPPPATYYPPDPVLPQPPRQPPPMQVPPPPFQSPPVPGVSPTSHSQAHHLQPSQPLPLPPPESQSRSPPPPSPSPPPREETVGILFYVKALYDYTATIDEEFDFQAGDVIAVTATPDDGWWSGELLDEARREEGRHVFPSNFVCLF
ncbi:hypothetical protein BD779DRAFT_1625039 [Infundibulicybe gibba]|nr:hypothetical protein BD779DRAFT_1625039 [Infundibulicybe gibba]